ncbi:hypothetical protein [Helicobacter sp. 16-1353]|uniref:hypothetical protein n=1 Tax=Helicobacter sp. 16-1353 TaxID=2004996 RepID=UPI0015EF31AE|nr:hypothetical protein [Helicobacter sp. 16-1353]
MVDCLKWYKKAAFRPPCVGRYFIDFLKVSLAICIAILPSTLTAILFFISFGWDWDIFEAKYKSFWNMVEISLIKSICSFTLGFTMFRTSLNALFSPL